MRIYLISFFLIFLFIVAAPPVRAEKPAEVFKGRVVAVYDGDTVTVLLPDKTTVKVRLAEIDAPEMAQAYGQKSKQALSAMIYDSNVVVIKTTMDRYGRTVGRIYKGELDVNRDMIRQGAAWAYRTYLKDQSLIDVETEAKAAKNGLWALQADQITPPWEWRKARRVANAKKKSSSPALVPSPSAPKQAANSNEFKCGGKKTCSKMKSCKEARFFLTQCGISTLDRDKDGTPCEALCK